MDTSMCHRGTIYRRATAMAAMLCMAALTAAAQTSANPSRPAWRRIGGGAMDLALASPATGPVSRVWFSPDGSRLYALTVSGRIFESADLETWSAPANPVQLPNLPETTAIRPPVFGAKLYPQDSRRAFALGAHLYRTDDAGASWTNLTAYGEASVIGSGMHDLALAPRDPDV